MDGSARLQGRAMKPAVPPAAVQTAAPPRSQPPEDCNIRTVLQHWLPIYLFIPLAQGEALGYLFTACPFMSFKLARNGGAAAALNNR